MHRQRARSATFGFISQAVLTFGALGWTLLLVLAPGFVSLTKPADPAFHLATGAYVAGSFLCHQRAERSFHLQGVQMPVCARCFGLYASAAAGAIFALAGTIIERRRSKPANARTEAAPFDLRRYRRLILMAAGPTAASVALEALTIWGQSPVIRSAAAIPLGVAIGWFVTCQAGAW